MAQKMDRLQPQTLHFYGTWRIIDWTIYAQRMVSLDHSRDCLNFLHAAWKHAG